MELTSRFTNPLELLLYAIPNGVYVYGSFVRFLCFDHQFHKTNIISDACLVDFVKYIQTNPIDLCLERNMAKSMIGILEIFGSIKFGINRIERKGGSTEDDITRIV